MEFTAKDIITRGIESARSEINVRLESVRENHREIQDMQERIREFERQSARLNDEINAIKHAIEASGKLPHEPFSIQKAREVYERKTSGGKIECIRYIKNTTAASLMDAKHTVEALSNTFYWKLAE